MYLYACSGKCSLRWYARCLAVTVLPHMSHLLRSLLSASGKCNFLCVGILYTRIILPHISHFFRRPLWASIGKCNFWWTDMLFTERVLPHMLHFFWGRSSFACTNLICFRRLYAHEKLLEQIAQLLLDLFDCSVKWKRIKSLISQYNNSTFSHRDA